MSSQKEKILHAAQQLFVEKGFAGTSMGAIATLAKVNKSLIFHHFGNKANLWISVKSEILDRSNKQLVNLPSTTLAWGEFLKELVSRNILFYRTNPDIARMIAWQRLESEENTIGITYSARAKEWLDAFAHYQQQGDIDTEVSPEFMVTFVLAILSSAALDQNSFIKEQEAYEAYLAFCVKAIDRAFTVKQE